MAKIVDPDNLNQGIEVVISTANRTIQLLKAGNLSDDGCRTQALYSFLKEEWNTDATKIPFPFPMESITDEQFEFINDWEPADVLTVNLLRDAGFLTRTSAGVVKEEYMGFDSVFPLDNNAQSSGDQVYIELDEPNGATQNMYITGQANQPIKIYGDASHGDVDYRNNNLRFFVREQGKSYGFASVSGLNVPTPLTYKKYAFPLSNGGDLKVSESDANIASQAPYTGMSITSYATPQTRDIGGTNRSFSIVIDGNNGTAEQIYEFVQYKLRQASDIDSDGTASLNGMTADELLEFVGDTLKTKQDRDGRGAYIDNFNTNDTNRLVFVDNSGTERTFPFVSAGSLNFNINLENDASAKYWMFFKTNPTGDFESADAVIVEDNGGNPVTGSVGGNSSISWDFDYDGNAQGGRTPGTDAEVVVVAIGLDTGQYVSTTATIGRAVGQNISLVAALERNYNNP